MKKLFWSLVILFSSFLSVQAVTKTEDRTNFKLLVTDVEFGKPFTITPADMAGQRADYLQADQGDQNLEIRFRFTQTDEQKVIDLIDGGFPIGDKPEMHMIKTKDPITHVSATTYSLVDEAKFASGALTSAGARTNTDEGDETTSVYRTKDLSSRNNRIPIFEMKISTVASYQNSFDIVFNFFSPDENIVGSLSDLDNDDNNDDNSGDNSDDEEEVGFDDETISSISNDISFVAAYEASAFNALNIVLVCREPDLSAEVNERNVCVGGDLNDVTTAINESIDNLQDSRDDIEKLGLSVKQFFKEKKITRKQAKSLLAKLSCAFRKDGGALKKLRKLKKQFSKAGSNENLFEKAALLVKANKLLEKVRKQLESAFRDCKVKFAQEGSSAGFINETTLNDFNDGDFESFSGILEEPQEGSD